MSHDSEWQKRKYAEDPVFRAKKRAANTAYKQSHKEEIAAKRADPVCAAREREGRRKSSFKKRYGITLEEYDAMVARQGGRCKVCKMKTEELLFVDHCHAFLAIRGLLCLHCNSMLGFAKDNPDVLQEGARYLRRFLKQMRRLLGDGNLGRAPSHFRRRNRCRPRKRCPTVPSP